MEKTKKEKTGRLIKKAPAAEKAKKPEKKEPLKKTRAAAEPRPPAKSAAAAKLKPAVKKKEAVRPVPVPEQPAAAAVKKHAVKPANAVEHAPKPPVAPASKHTAAHEPAPVKEHPVKIEHPVRHEHPPKPVSTAKPAAVPPPAAPKPSVAPVQKPEIKSAPVAQAAAAAPAAVAPAAAVSAPVRELKELVLELPITVKDLSIKLQEKPSNLIKVLMSMGVMAGINQAVSDETVARVCEKYGFKPTAAPDEDDAALLDHARSDSVAELLHRAPIVTLMGHVDHGKTSLLDAIRKSKVADSEFGGITQHIGAYRVALPKGEITFLDTPGHEAFTAMRARGAKATDIVVIVVAADDGVMPQTQEAIDHAKAAGVTIIVALNKVDKPQADVDRVKKQLSTLGLMAEDWGGKTVMVPVSAKTGQGIDTLLEMIVLEAEMLELKANPERSAKGVVLEGRMVKNKGPVSTLLVQNGTLHLNESIIVGDLYGKVRAMFDDRGRPVTAAGPSRPVEVLGITGVPEAGEQFFCITDERMAKELALRRQEKERLRQMQPVKRLGLEDLYSQIKAGKIKELPIILKADAQGSIEAIREALKKIPSDEVKLVLIHEGVGNVNTSDVILAVASGALILGFNVVTDDQAKSLIEKEGQDVRIYNIIYELVNEIRQALEGMLAPKLKRIFLGRAEVRKIFKLSSGIFAGCYVAKGKIVRSAQVSLMRNGQSVHEGELASLKRFKDDVREVEEGFECGMALKGFNDVLEGDTIEAFTIQKIARTFE